MISLIIINKIVFISKCKKNELSSYISILSFDHDEINNFYYFFILRSL